MYLFDDENEQWISDGNAVFLMSGMPHFDRASLFEAYDIPAKQQKKIVSRHCKLPEEYCFEDFSDNETEIEQCPISVRIGALDITPYMTSQGIAFINSEYLVPISDAEDDNITFWERATEDGEMYFAIKNGMILIGIIALPRVINEQFVNELKTLAAQCEVALFNSQNSTEETK